MSGLKRHTVRPWLAGVSLLLLGLLLQSVRAAEIQLAELMSMLSQVKQIDAAFVETRHSSFLNTALKLNGRIKYEAPGKFSKETLSPFSETITLDKSFITIVQRDGDISREVSVDSNPVISGFVESVRSTLAGDSTVLEEHFSVALNGSRPDWSLSLSPRNTRMMKLVERIVIRGQEQQLVSIETVERDGDVSLILISE